ncbi:MAG TPA: ATP-dependent helicase, partial [Porticoccus sp.]|nr:ATP-dependent helicase [Porticoccus sp.]
PKDIVGAIANEAGIESQHIGRIRLENDHSTVDLPEGMPKDIFNHLKNKVRVCQQPMRLSLPSSSLQKNHPASDKPKDKKSEDTKKPSQKRSPRKDTAKKQPE